MVRMQQFQTLQDPAAPIAIPYARLPQMKLDASKIFAGANTEFAGEFVNFSHPTEVNAQRLVINPSVSFPLVDKPAYYVTPKVGLNATYYSMGANNTTSMPDAVRVLPIISLDSGVAFENESRMFSGDYVQTLEPRAFYVYIPYKDQSTLPNFDSAQADFNFTQIFTENRFYGSDRIGDANQVTLALTSRLLEQENGMERLKLMVGERISFSTPQVNLVTPSTTTNKSDILMALTGRVTSRLSLDSDFQFDPNQSHMQRFNFAVSYRPEAGKVLNLGYRFTRNTLRQVDLSTQWPISGRWHAVGRWNYSLQDSRILDTIGGLEYSQDCWMLRMVAQQFATATQQSNTGFFIQLELNDFVKVGADPLDLLKQSVPGYTKLNDIAPIQPAQVFP